MEFEIGQRVCIVGQGLDNIVHTHNYRVKRLTKTLIITATPDGVQRRFQKDTQRSIPHSAYGGTRVDIKCQKV